MHFKNKYLNAKFSWSSILTVTVFLFTFIVPVLPEGWGKTPVRLSLTLVFIAAVLSVDKRKRIYLYLALGAIFLEWLSLFFELWFLVNASKLLNILFFFIVAFTLIRQVATAKIVTSKEILESISGYLLLGIIYSIVISVIMQNDPGAYNLVREQGTGLGTVSNLSTSLYYGFITLASLGYGDIVPLEPYTRSLASLICISGQLYIAIIISLLVGKYASGTNSKV
jgi:hypothetical protein